MSDFIERLVYSALILPFTAWIFMLCEGGLADDFGWPMMSYGHAILACIGLSALLTMSLSAITFELVGTRSKR